MNLLHAAPPDVSAFIEDIVVRSSLHEIDS